MTNGLDAREFQAELQRLDAVLQDVERTGDPASRERTREIVRAVLALHGAGLERLLSHLDAAGAAGQPILDGTEIDEMLTLRVLTLTDEEKRAMAGIDGRASDLLARTESLAREKLSALHGTLRNIRPLPGECGHE